MKVLFDTHNITFQNYGGQGIQIRQTKKSLERLGIEVKFFNKFEDNISDYDIFHIFGSNSIEHINLIEYVKDKNIPIVLSPIYWSGFEQSFKTSNNICSKLFTIIKKGQQYSEKIFKYNIAPINPTYFYLKTSNIVLPNSNLEAKHLMKNFDLKSSKIHVVYNGVDGFYLNEYPDLFIDRYNISDFVLFVGRIEPKKNVISLIKAMNDLKFQTVLIGSKNANRNYYDKCVKCANKNIHFIDQIPPNTELLRSAYHAAKVFVLPSWLETPGIASLEAGLAGCNLVISDRGSTKEYFKDMVLYCDPNNVKSIKDSIKSAMDKNKTDKLSRHILKNYTWESIAKETLIAYNKII